MYTVSPDPLFFTVRGRAPYNYWHYTGFPNYSGTSPKGLWINETSETRTKNFSPNRPTSINFYPSVIQAKTSVPKCAL